jgi:hypothetical protein
MSRIRNHDRKALHDAIGDAGGDVLIRALPITQAFAERATSLTYRGMSLEERVMRLGVSTGIFDKLRADALAWDRPAVPAKERVTRTFDLSEAARELRKSRRWLQDWLRDHPVDAVGIPFYAPMGRTKTFDENDLTRIRAAVREEERCRLNQSRPAKAKARTGRAVAPTSESTLTALRNMLGSGRQRQSSKNGSDRSNVASMKGRSPTS